MAALRAKAAKGDSHAAAQLLQWRREYPPTSERLDLAALSEQQLEAMLVRIKREIDEEDAANQANP